MLNLVFGGHFVFWRKKLHRVIMKYHVKSGASSLKINAVMNNLVFGGHFVFGQKIAEGYYEQQCNIWSLLLGN